jgi:hypothetical protein
MATSVTEEESQETKNGLLFSSLWDAALKLQKYEVRIVVTLGAVKGSRLFATRPPAANIYNTAKLPQNGNKRSRQ